MILFYQLLYLRLYEHQKRNGDGLPDIMLEMRAGIAFVIIEVALLGGALTHYILWSGVGFGNLEKPIYIALSVVVALLNWYILSDERLQNAKAAYKRMDSSAMLRLTIWLMAFLLCGFGLAMYMVLCLAS